MDQMNLQLHHVISHIVGQTGLAIVDAILAGQRDPLELAKLRGERIKASEAVIAKSLVGDYRHEHLSTSLRLLTVLNLLRASRKGFWRARLSGARLASTAFSRVRDETLLENAGLPRAGSAVEGGLE